MDNKNKELDRLNGVYMKLLDGAGVEYFEGRGKLVDAHTVEVGGKKYTVSALCNASCQTYADCIMMCGSLPIICRLRQPWGHVFVVSLGYPLSLTRTWQEASCSCPT